MQVLLEFVAPQGGQAQFPSTAVGVALLALTEGLLETVRDSERRTAPYERYAQRMIGGFNLAQAIGPFRYTGTLEAEAADMLDELLRSTDFVRDAEQRMQASLMRVWRAYAQRLSPTVAASFPPLTSQDADIHLEYADGALSISVTLGG